VSICIVAEAAVFVALNSLLSECHGLDAEIIDQNDKQITCTLYMYFGYTIRKYFNFPPFIFSVKHFIQRFCLVILFLFKTFYCDFLVSLTI